jgi:hypothetical protein
VEFPQVHRIEENFTRRVGMPQETFCGIPAKRTLVNDVSRLRAQSPHGVVVSIRVLARPCGVGDSILIPDEGDAELVAAIEKILGKGRRGAADQIEEIERSFVPGICVAKMNQLDRSAMNQAAPFQYSAKGNDRRSALAAADGGQSASMREARRQRERATQRGTDIA